MAGVDESATGTTTAGAGLLEPRLEGRANDDLSFLLSSRRTRLSFQRTRMSTDRTLMSIIRTALSMIGFGFTIFEFFRALHESPATQSIVRAEAGRNFGTSLVVLGLLILTLGTFGHVRFMLGLRREHQALVEERLLPPDRLPFSMTLAVAVLLWVLGLVAAISMVTRARLLG